MEPERIDRWQDWPRDVVDRLRQWNTERRLSFRGRRPFECGTCWNTFSGNPYGNAVLDGANLCDDCLIKTARVPS